MTITMVSDQGHDTNWEYFYIRWKLMCRAKCVWKGGRGQIEFRLLP